MKTPHRYTTIGLVLFSASLLGLSPQVAAQEQQTPPITATRTEPATNNQIQLNQAIDEAVEAGLIVVTGDPLTVNSQEEAQDQITEQTAVIQAVTASHQTAETAYQAEERRYQDSLNQRRQVLNENKALLTEHVKNTLTYQEQLRQYQIDKERYDQAKAREDQAIADYEANYHNHLILYKEWELEKALYDEKVAQAQAQTTQDGSLSQVHAQHLIFKSEPNAQVSFSGVDSFIAAHHDFGAALNGIGSKANDVPQASTPHLSVGVGAATAAGPGNGYGLILKKNHPITVTYTNLEKSSYKGRAIRKVVYTYELTSTFAADNSATTFIYSDPTKTIYTGTGGDNQGLVDFNIHQTITYYYDDTEQVILDSDSTALFSFASRNNTFEFGEQEYVRLGGNMTFIPITGSSVTGEDGYLAARGSNNSTADGSRLNRGDWDIDGHANEYYGAGVAKVTGTTIAFDFGIRYSQADISRSANPGRLRNGSRQWFTVNSDLKASGWLDSSLRPAPTPPEQPQLDSSLIEPTAPNKPILKLKSVPTILRRPKAPDKPLIIYYPIKVAPPVPVAVPPIEKTTTRPSLPAPQISATTTKPSSQTSLAVIYLPVTTHTSQWAPPSQNTRPLRPVHPIPNTANQRPKLYYSGETAADAYEKGLVPALKANPTLMEKALPEYWFGINTGFTDPKERQAIMDFIRQAGKVARQTYPDNKGAVNREIAQSLAHAVYSEDNLQKLFNEYGVPLKIENFDNISDYIDKNHNSISSSVPIDFAHIMTTLASLEHQDSGIKNLIRALFNRDFAGALPSLNGKANILHQNALLGDILTTLSQKDALSDMDAIILSKHPKFNKLPMDERLLTYYSQPNLDKRRYQLLLETYSDTPAIAKTKLFGELLLSAASLGGVLATGYGIFLYRTRVYEDLDGDGINEFNLKKSLRHAPTNIAKSIVAIVNNIVATDRHIFQGALVKFAQNPIKAISSYQTEFGKKLLKETVNGIVGVKLPFSTIKTAAGIFLTNTITKPLMKLVTKPKKKLKTATPLPNDNQPLLPNSQQHPRVKPKVRQTPKQPVPNSSFNGPLLPSGGNHGVPSSKKPNKPKAKKPSKKPSILPPKEDYPRLPSSNPIGRGTTKPTTPTKTKRPAIKTPNPSSSLNGPVLPSGGNNGVPSKPKTRPQQPKPKPNKAKPIHLPKKEEYPRLPTSNPITRGSGKPKPTPQKPGQAPKHQPPAPVSNSPLLPSSNPINRGTAKPAPKPKTPPKPPAQPKATPKPSAQPKPKPNAQPRPATPKAQPRPQQPKAQQRPPKSQPKPPQQPKRGKKR